jgi:flagellar basal-body rod modification protein FlgD
MTVSSTSGSNPYSSLLSASATSTAATATTASTATASGSTGSTQNLAQTFLQLLVAQMNNQDPLNPVDNNQITTQMAQISTVTGINNLNSSVSGLMSELQQSAALQSAQLTGHSVMVAGSGLDLASNSSASTGVSSVGAFSLGSSAANVAVTVKDASGNTVRTLSLGAMSGGLQDFTWDGSTDAGGTAAAGSYTYSVQATTSTGAAVAATQYNLQTVVGTVPQSNGGTMLMLGNGKQVSTSSVAQII